MNEYLILVDENDVEYGVMEKLQVHQSGFLHRAFSIFIFNSKGELLIQQRASGKYHSGGLWTNSCCSHPRQGESVAEAVTRRLKEEMGMVCETRFLFSFIYKATFENGLTEHEYDHVYFGMSDETPVPDKSEVQAWKYMSIPELDMDIRNNPGLYTEWLKICMPELKKNVVIPLLKNSLGH